MTEHCGKVTDEQHLNSIWAALQVTWITSLARGIHLSSQNFPDPRPIWPIPWVIPSTHWSAASSRDPSSKACIMWISILTQIASNRFRHFRTWVGGLGGWRPGKETLSEHRNGSTWLVIMDLHPMVRPFSLRTCIVSPFLSFQNVHVKIMKTWILKLDAQFSIDQYWWWRIGGIIGMANTCQLRWTRRQPKRPKRAADLLRASSSLPGGLMTSGKDLYHKSWTEFKWYRCVFLCYTIIYNKDQYSIVYIYIQHIASYSYNLGQFSGIIESSATVFRCQRRRRCKASCHSASFSHALTTAP